MTGMTGMSYPAGLKKPRQDNDHVASSGINFSKDANPAGQTGMYKVRLV